MKIFKHFYSHFRP